MNLIRLLEDRADEIIKEANRALMSWRLTHYQKAGEDKCKRCLKTLYHFISKSIKKCSSTSLILYVQNITRERFNSGYDIQEVQIAFNILEEAIWKKVLEEVDNMTPVELGKVLGTISTVCGTGKDTLADTYVMLSGKTGTPSLDIEALFKGTDCVLISDCEEKSEQEHGIES